MTAKNYLEVEDLPEVFGSNDEILPHEWPVVKE